MRSLFCLLMVCIAMSAPTPAAAQRFNGNYPVCLQRWEWGGGTYISCLYNTWEDCKADAAGFSAMCLLNPYVQRPSQPDRRPRPR